MTELRESTPGCPEDLRDLCTLLDFVRWGASRFNEAGLWFGHGTDNAWDEALVLVMHTLHLPMDSKPEVLSARLTMSERREVMAILKQRVDERLPAAYLTHEAHFCDMTFYVDSRVLVPRSPIAELIRQEFQPWLATEPLALLDLCCGSGCIGIACAEAFPEARVDLSDISSGAVDVAQININRHQLNERVRAVQSDMFSGLEGCSYDLIVCNPPYVDARDLAEMPAEYQAEPEIALGSGDDGLDFTRRLLREAANHLQPEGILVCEVGNSWEALESAFPEVPFLWPEFEDGGHGVFVISREELLAYQGHFADE
ncbi:50S ribosomal protein L3 N(5)-glutamine methyltransferase [Microbulbifer flavimaris]|uniref:Ribosomal protein uL3 glutamine methyltransferase n=1 Tax=Microbulbifer flavimaris TaxID=1781068 RepID=A0ABX4I1V0_9GAMM|nr:MULTISPECIES: 50S ribosomal protein L3 N(5)-glutamine methyltransferase [Microbulbifer]KUJ84225.1 ribosomal protein L3 N(5)-glutamine methyltransferase [Microbulbifer sp. ZGT114]PCO06301.1 50S ribosomal protein L3 N(5)-glutamine methyltransferase [Microbulbifer flavimaris]